MAIQGELKTIPGMVRYSKNNPMGFLVNNGGKSKDIVTHPESYNTRNSKNKPMGFWKTTDTKIEGQI